MLFRLLRPHPPLVARFATGSIGRAALTAASIRLIREFLAGVLDDVVPPNSQSQLTAEVPGT